jgi:hypothetical protein
VVLLELDVLGAFIFARGFVVSSLVRNFFETFAIAGMMHCTTVIRSTSSHDRAPGS